MNQIVIKNTGIKRLLGLFGQDEKLEIIELGDTWHPADGFVDKTFFKDVRTIKDFLMIDYDFKGLVMFDAKAARIEIHYDSDKDEFTLTGDSHELNIIEYKLKSVD